MTRVQKLDEIASRILAEDRRETSERIGKQTDQAETNILSASQMASRLKREVFSQNGDMDTLRIVPGCFNRVWVRDLHGLNERVTDE